MKMIIIYNIIISPHNFNGHKQSSSFTTVTDPKLFKSGRFSQLQHTVGLPSGRVTCATDFGVELQW